MYAVRWSCIYKRFQFEQDVVMVLVYWHRGGHLSYLSPLIKAGNAGVVLKKVPASPCPSFDNSDAGRMISSRARPVGSLDSEKTMRGGEKSDER